MRSRNLPAEPAPSRPTRSISRCEVTPDLLEEFPQFHVEAIFVHSVLPSVTAGRVIGRRDPAKYAKRAECAQMSRDRSSS